MVRALLPLLAAALAAAPAVASEPIGGGTPRPRIVNGLPTGAFPTTAALLEPLGPFCSATLVGCETVLTAAHCVCQSGGVGPLCPNGSPLIDPAGVVVFLPHAGFFGVYSIEVNPTFDFGVTGDVALLRLSTPVRSVAPSTVNTSQAVPNGTLGTIAGWGNTTGSGLDGGVKRYGTVETASCSGVVPDAPHVCWSFAAPVGPPGDDSNTCYGDSGGPLFVDFGAGARLAGVTSGGLSASCQQPDLSWDADVFYEQTWIVGTGGADLGNAVCGEGAQVEGGSVTTVHAGGFLSSGTPQGFHSFSVPVGTVQLRVALNGEDTISPSDPNDFDLYVRAGSPPTTSVFDCASEFIGAFEYCQIQDPAPGTWHVLAQRFDGIGEYQMTATMVPSSPEPPALAEGDAVVVSAAPREILRVDTGSGDRALVSSSLRGGGEPFSGPLGAAVDGSGRVLVTDPTRSSLLRLDPATGDRSVVSGCADLACSSIVGAGSLLLYPVFAEVDADESILVTDSLMGVHTVFRIDPVTGDRSVVTGCATPLCSSVVGAGPSLVGPTGVDVEAGGTLVLADTGLNAVLRVDPATGDRTVLTGCVDALCTSTVGAGPDLGNPADLVLAADGGVLVADADASTPSPFRAVLRVDPVTGARTVLSGCADAACTSVVGGGPEFTAGLVTLDVEPGGGILVVDFLQSAVFRVDPATGDRTILSGCEPPGCPTVAGAGTDFSVPTGVAVVPLPEPPGALALPAGLALLALLGRRRARATVRRATRVSATVRRANRVSGTDRASGYPSRRAAARPGRMRWSSSGPRTTGGSARS